MPCLRQGKGIAMTLDDLKEFRPHLDGHNLTDDQKDELIRCVWLIMQSFVDSAWGVHAVQLARKDLQIPFKGLDSGSFQSAKE
jgi:hypothetical protein